ncbi:MAG: reductoisomerase C-terminal domain, partial [Pseudomonadota bacterium]
VEAFLDRRLGFRKIPGVIESVMNSMPVEPVVDLEGVLALDHAARLKAREMIEV